MKRTIAIGDIHGGLKALIQLLERINITPEDQLIFLGDYVDGWSDSAYVVSYLIELAKQNTCIFLRGNHDDLTHQWLKTGNLREKWLQNGGQSSIDGYRNFSSEEIALHGEFFNQMLNYYINPDGQLFVHAGFTNQGGPEMEYENWPFYWDRTLWEMVLSMDLSLEPEDPFYPQRLKIFKEIFIGHTPVTRIGKTTPFHKANVWNIDTGAAFKGPVSAIEVTTKQIWQSDPVYQFYPGENGRN